MIRVNIKEIGEVLLTCPITAKELLLKYAPQKECDTIACRINHIPRPLSWKVEYASTVEFVSKNSVEGNLIYKNSLAFLITVAASKAFNARVHLKQSIGDSYYYCYSKGIFTKQHLSILEKELRSIIAKDTPITFEYVSYDKAKEIMKEQNYTEKENLLKWVHKDPLLLYKCEDIYDFASTVLAERAGKLSHYDLSSYGDGFLITFPFFSEDKDITQIDHSLALPTEKTFEIMTSYSKWLTNLSIDTMDDIYEIVARGKTRDLILLSESLHTQNLYKISEQIISNPEIKLICIAGPSSSGKTTSSKRLRIQLLTAAINSVTLELDNYFKNRSETPRDINGNYNFDSIDALDIDLINEHLEKLMDGQEVQLPEFNFLTGERVLGKKLKLKENEKILIEGIHGLNNYLTKSIKRENKFKIFISPLTGTSIDLHNKIGTTDTRLLRRMVRDHRTRGHTPESTLLQWQSVIRSSFKYIFPFQNGADAIFNTSLAYELPVLKSYVLPLLEGIPETSPVYDTSYRLINMLELIPLIPSDNIPNDSIVREFIGGSCF
ncbi:MAG: nucleoside kinase [Synergistaceae bacterium]